LKKLIMVWAIASMVIAITTATGKTAGNGGLAGQVAAPDAAAAAAFSESVLWNFGVTSDDGATPASALIADQQGNLYGTTFVGGTNNLGTVFELSPPSGKQKLWNERVLWRFDATADDGGVPAAALIADQQGNFYGTTTRGGGRTCDPSVVGCGTVFELSPPSGQQTQWTERVLWSFGATGDGWFPLADLIADSKGNLYGTTEFGGAYCQPTPPVTDGGCGIVFELSPPSGQQTQWSETVLWSFGAGADGFNPMAGLIADQQGNLYGTTFEGGANKDGAAFELSPPSGQQTQWSETVLWSFGATKDDGGNPETGLIADQQGNLYGTNQSNGGKENAGTAFELSPPSGEQTQWSERLLWTFGAKNDGSSPSSLIADQQGNFYGSTYFHGAKKDGVAFELSPPSGKHTQWSLHVLQSFGAKNDGQGPSGLIADQQGNLYGTTFEGGPTNDGLVFELRKH
jgi:uncharacterized repeat protein (TIGR03803 family)